MERSVGVKSKKLLKLNNDFLCARSKKVNEKKREYITSLNKLWKLKLLLSNDFTVCLE